MDGFSFLLKHKLMDYLIIQEHLDLIIELKLEIHNIL